MSLSEHIAGIRTDYRQASLDEAAAGDDPLAFFTRWFGEAERSGIEEVNAMTLATVDESGAPHARIVLLKGLEEGQFVFYTNYDSAKGKQLKTHNRAALVFFWKELERQVRVEGTVSEVTAQQSDDYFHSRPEGSQLGAWASPQSQKIESRQALEENLERVKNNYTDGTIPRPPHWGGFQLMPERIEFWQGRSNRLHDRVLFEKMKYDGWKKSRLAP